jgi:hypothetical protein
MGWDYLTQGLPGNVSANDYLRRCFSWEKPETGARSEVLDCAMVGSVWYAALRCTHDVDGTMRTYTTALVALTSRRGGQFGYKDMSESMGPYECDCPDRIMALLSPVADLPYASCAADWRASVVAKKAARGVERSKLAALRPGATVRLDAPARFGRYGALQEFTALARVPGQRGERFECARYPGIVFSLPASHIARATITAN